MLQNNILGANIHRRKKLVLVLGQRFGDFCPLGRSMSGTLQTFYF